MSELIEGEIEKIAFGGEGILRHQGVVTFIPFTAPGDIVLASITQKKKNFSKGHLEKVLISGPDRIEARCPYFQKCGGCQLQHISYQAQLQYKKEAVEDALQRIGKLACPPLIMVGTHLNWNYRRHVTLQLQPHNNKFQAGYIAVDGFSLLKISCCPIFINEKNDLMIKLQNFVSKIPNSQSVEGKLIVLKKTEEKFILLFRFPAEMKLDFDLFERELSLYDYIQGIVIEIEGRQTVYLGDPFVIIKIDDLSFRFTPETFVQNHPEQSLNIYRQVSAIVHSISGGSFIEGLDLYCGFGITSLLLAQRGHKVIGIENNKKSIEFALENRQLNNIEGADFLLGNVEKVLPKLRKVKPNFVIVNPPRIGISPSALDEILKVAPKHIIYISCMPATLARDLSVLCGKGYQIKECCAYDMFPQTAHVETLVHLSL